MKLEPDDNDDDPHGLDDLARMQAITGAVREAARENPSFARRLEKFLDRMIIIAEDRELLGLPRGCFPTRARYLESLRRNVESAERELENATRELEATERELASLEASDAEAEAIT